MEIILEDFLVTNYNINFKRFVEAFDNTQEHDILDITNFIALIRPELWIENIFSWQEHKNLTEESWINISTHWMNTCKNNSEIFFYKPKQKKIKIIKLKFEGD